MESPVPALCFTLQDSSKPRYSYDMCSLHNSMNKKEDSFMGVESSQPETSGYFESADTEALTDMVQISSDGEYYNRLQFGNKTDPQSEENSDDINFSEHEGNITVPVKNSLALTEDTLTSACYDIAPAPVEGDGLAAYDHSQPLEVYEALTAETLDLHEDNISETLPPQYKPNLYPITFAPDFGDVTIYNLSQSSMQRLDEVNLDLQFHPESYQPSSDYMQIPAAVGNKFLSF